MGFLGDTAEKIRSYFRSDKASSGKQFAKGSTMSGASSTGYDVLQAYGYDVVSDYLKMEHDLLSRYVDYEEMDDYPELTAAIDIFADDATQTDMQLNRSMWVTSKDKDLEKLCNDLLHKTLRVDEDIWEIARTLCKYGNCVRKGSLVWTENGPKPIENVEPGEYVQSIKDGEQVLLPVKERFSNGIKEIYRVRTKHREIFVTAEHPVLVDNNGTHEWVPAGELKIKRYESGQIDPTKTSKLVISTSAPARQESPTWEAILGEDVKTLLEQGWGEKGTPSKLILPDRVTPWFCNLLGFMLGDGFLGNDDPNSSSTQVSFSRGVDSAQYDKYDNLFERLGLKPVLSEDASTSIVSSVRLKRLLLHLGFTNGSSEKKMPPWVGSLPREHRLAFLKGFIDADGWSTQQETWSRPAFHFEIANIPLAKELKALVDGLGLRSGNLKIRHREPGFKIKDKVVKTTQPTATLTFSYFEYDPGFRSENLLELSKWGEDEVFDIEIDDDSHNFVVDGVVVHNSYEEILVDENGVRGLNFLPPPTVRRVEGPRGELYGFIQDFKGRTGYSPAELHKIIAQRASGSHSSGRMEHVVALEDWEVVHFRLRNKQRRSIYGNSVLDGSRWIWKRLMLLEDSALVYRLQRAPERYAFYIDTGSLPPKEALAHVNKVRQNFKKKKFINPTTGKMDLKFNSLSPDEDIFIPATKGNDSTRVEVLGSPSWQHMDDIEYFRDKMFSTLKIPKAYLGQDQGVARAVLSSEDTRFARSVQRIQRELRNGFSKIIRIHLAAIGIDPSRAEFQVHMTSPSSIFELAQLEVRNARADLASRMREHVSLPWVLANVFNMGDKEVETIIKQREEDTIRDMGAEGKGQAAAARANPEEGGFGGSGGFDAATPDRPQPEDEPAGELRPQTQDGPVVPESLSERRRVSSPRSRASKPSPTELDAERRANENFNRLMENDRNLSKRIHEIRGMVRELVKYTGNKY